MLEAVLEATVPTAEYKHTTCLYLVAGLTQSSDLWGRMSEYLTKRRNPNPIADRYTEPDSLHHLLRGIAEGSHLCLFRGERSASLSVGLSQDSHDPTLRAAVQNVLDHVRVPFDNVDVLLAALAQETRGWTVGSPASDFAFELAAEHSKDSTRKKSPATIQLFERLSVEWLGRLPRTASDWWCHPWAFTSLEDVAKI